MSEELNAALQVISEKMQGVDLGGSVKFDVEEMGSILVDGDGARIADEEADVTLKAAADVFQDMLSGDIDPTSAFMSGKLSIEGDMGLAMKLAQSLG